MKQINLKVNKSKQKFIKFTRIKMDSKNSGQETFKKIIP